MHGLAPAYLNSVSITASKVALGRLLVFGGRGFIDAGLAAYC